MLNLITLSISIFLISLTGWTFITYLIKKDSRKFIREELSNLTDIFKKIFLSLKNLIRILVNFSFSHEKRRATSSDETEPKEDEQPLNLVKPIKEIKDQTTEKEGDYDDDDALSSFSPEVVDVINEEEEKVA